MSQWREIRKTWGTEPPNIADYTVWVHDRIKQMYAELGCLHLEVVWNDGRVYRMRSGHECDIMAEWMDFFFTGQRGDVWVTWCRFRAVDHSGAGMVSVI